MSAWQPPTGSGSEPTGQTAEGLQIPYSRRQSKPVDNRLATAGWDLITITQLLISLSNNLTLGSWTLPLQATILYPEAVSTMMWLFSYKADFQRYNSLEMDED